MDWLLLQPYPEPNVCALLRVIFAAKPPVQAKVQRSLTTRLATATNPPPPTPLSECLFFFGVFLSMLAQATGP